MLIENGYIKIKEKTGGGMNPDTGYPIKSDSSFGVNIPCQFRANKYSNKGKANGESFIIASYEILIEEQSFTSEQLSLFDLAGKELGEFSIMETEQLSAVCQIKILV